ncbi:MAG TPA: 2,3-bisphosphoglycerate-independent phosphoglycerate mutase, partial [Clostridiales bacterium]|nr:2,3-bisphosphoglycerate-independent phosphoglycerate mutase [Clostridiales bacterium]
HCFLDGRDVPPDSGAAFVRELEQKIEELGTGRIATVMGRYYAMDRDNRWERVSRAYAAMTAGQGLKACTGSEAVEASYKRKEMDEFVVPTVITNDRGSPLATVSAGDAVIFFNFRPDRAREITRAFVDADFKGFDRSQGRIPVKFVCMTQYDKTIQNVEIAFKPESLDNTFGETVSRHGLKQLRIAETEKYAHVTFFFNGGQEAVYPGEDRVLIPSPKVATYDLKPEMSAGEVTDAVVERIRSGVYDVIILNYANPDMVGHTGIFEAAVRAIETVDACIGRVAEAVLEQGGALLITADHGNAEIMTDPLTGGPMTAHSTFPVPFIAAGMKNIQLKSGRLADIAPTLLELLDIPVPKEMTGTSLIQKIPQDTAGKFIHGCNCTSRESNK